MGYRLKQASKALLCTKGRANNLLQLNLLRSVDFILPPKNTFAEEVAFILCLGLQSSEETAFHRFKTLITSSWGKVDLCLQRLIQHSNGCPIHYFFF